MRVRTRRARLVGLAVGVAMVGGCSTVSSTVTEGSSSPVSASAPTASATSPADVQAQFAADSAAVERELATLSGMEAELGGPDRVDDALTALATKAAALSAPLERKASTGRFAAPVAGVAATVEGMWVAGMITANGAAQLINVSDRMDPRKAATQTETKVDGDSRFETTHSVDRVTTSASGTTTADGLTGKIKYTLDASPCPDRDGKVSVKGTLELSSQVTGGRTGTKIKAEFEITARVDDDARVGAADYTLHVNASSTGADGEQYVDVTSGSTSETKVNGVSPNASSDFTSRAMNSAFAFQDLVKRMAMDAIRKSIESGRCVDLQIATSPGKRTGLAPSTKVQITAKPRSKVDGSPTGGTVTATLSGDTSLDPQGSKVRADADFTYVAAGEAKKRATVSFEARSKRGVGRAEAGFETGPGAYTVSGSIPSKPIPTTFEGTICATDKPFTLTLGGAMPGQLIFTPTSEEAGSWTYSGKAFNAPFPISGSGGYTLVAGSKETPGSLKFTFKATIRTPVGSRSGGGPANLTLTPREPCG